MSEQVSAIILDPELTVETAAYWAAGSYVHSEFDTGGQPIDNILAAIQSCLYINGVRSGDGEQPETVPGATPYDVEIYRGFFLDAVHAFRTEARCAWPADGARISYTEVASGGEIQQ